MEGVFITGIDTDVGKTAVSAGLLKLLQSYRKACYWKPIQTGTIVSDDTREVQNITGLGPEFFVEPAYRFAEPVAPHVAAKKWGQKIDVQWMAKIFGEKTKEGNFLIVEGAGGLLVPLNETDLLIDFMDRIRLPIIFVAEDRLGAINQTLLSLRVAREKGLEVLGAVLTRSRRTFGNADSIAHFGKVEILAELEQSEDPKNIVAQIGGHKRLRELFNVPQLPN